MKKMTILKLSYVDFHIFYQKKKCYFMMEKKLNDLNFFKNLL